MSFYSYVDCECGMARIRSGIGRCGTCETAYREGARAASAEEERDQLRAVVAELLTKVEELAEQLRNHEVWYSEAFDRTRCDRCGTRNRIPFDEHGGDFDRHPHSPTCLHYRGIS